MKTSSSCSLDDFIAMAKEEIEEEELEKQRQDLLDKDPSFAMRDEDELTPRSRKIALHAKASRKKTRNAPQNIQRSVPSPSFGSTSLVRSPENDPYIQEGDIRNIKDELDEDLERLVAVHGMDRTIEQVKHDAEDDADFKVMTPSDASLFIVSE